MPSQRSPSLQDIADATGYSLMTVSRAVRGVGAVSAKAHNKILAEAKKIGYRHNPQITRMMSMMRGGHRNQYQETLAMVWFCSPQMLQTHPSLSDIWAGARKRAEQLGYVLDPIYFSEYQKSPQRLCEVLKSRGIRGVILGPVLNKRRQDLLKMDFEWDAFSWVAFGNTQTNKEFNRVGHHHFFGMELLMQKLSEKGYQRPALWISRVLDNTAHQAFSGSFITHHPLPLREALPLLDLGRHKLQQVPSWLKKAKADCVITTSIDSLKKELSKSPEAKIKNIGVASLHLIGKETVSGIDQQTDVLGSYAVDMAIAQIHRGDFGLPDEPKLMLNKGRWREGNSC